MRGLIRTDYGMFLKHHKLKPGFKTFLNIYLTHSMAAAFLYRISRYLYLKEWRFLSRLFYLLNIFLTGADILPTSNIAEGVMIIHTVGTSIDCVIGKNCIILGQAGLGGDPFKDTDVGAGPGVAVIGDNVLVGIGSRVLGPVRIGNNVIIGAMSLVIDSVPDNMVAAGIPAKVLRERTEKDSIKEHDIEAIQRRKRGRK